jgi:hypothetical protein
MAGLGKMVYSTGDTYTGNWKGGTQRTFTPRTSYLAPSPSRSQFQFFGGPIIFFLKNPSTSLHLFFLSDVEFGF